MSLSLIEKFVQTLPPSKFRLITWTDFSAAVTFDSASRGIVTAFTNDIDVKYCRFDSCVVAAGWSDFVSCNFLRIDNSTFERAEEFKYLGTTLTNQNYIAEEIKSRLKSGNACYHSVESVVF